DAQDRADLLTLLQRGEHGGPEVPGGSDDGDSHGSLPHLRGARPRWAGPAVASGGSTYAGARAAGRARPCPRPLGLPGTGGLSWEQTSLLGASWHRTKGR